MIWFLIALCAAIYLTIGALFAYATKDNVEGSARWVALPLIALFWPVVILGILISFIGWMNRGSH